MATYPENLSYFSNKISGWSQNTVRVTPGTLNFADPGDISIFTLPENSLVDLSTLAICGGAVGICGATTDSWAIFPRNASSFIDMLTVEINGTTIDGSLVGYNHLAKLFTDFEQENTKTQRAVLGLAQDHAGSGQLARIGAGAATGTGQIGFTSAPTSANADLANGTLAAHPFAITNYHGFLGCSKIIDTSLLGTVRIIIRWAPRTIMMRAANQSTADPTYRLVDLKMYCNVCDLSDGLYYSSMQARMETAPLVIPFKRYLSFSGPSVTSSTSLRFSVSTQSLDAVYMWLQPSTVSRNAPNDSTSFVSNGYFNRSAIGVSSFQWDINSCLYPSFSANAADAYYLLMNTLGLQTDDTVGAVANLTSGTWANNLFAFSYRFSHSKSLQFMSGLDSRGLSLNGVCNLVCPGSTNYLPFIVAECTAHLQVGKFRSVSMVA